MPTNTPNYNFSLPTVGGDRSTWGGFLNANWTSLDALLTGIDAAIAINISDIADNVIDIATNAADIATNTADIATNAAAIAALTTLIQDTAHPIGSLYISRTDTDPAVTLGYGTWAAEAAGVALVGAGDNGESVWAVGDERGSETHTLTDAQMPSHGHKLSSANNMSGGSVYNVSAGGLTGNKNVNTNNAGGDQPHNNIQPSKAYYIWTRTA